MIDLHSRHLPPERVSEHPCSMHRVSLIIPTLNEERGLQRILPALPHWIDEIIIVDGGSSDDTVAVATSRCPEARIIHQQSHGKGGALKEGIRAATGTIIVTMDADGSMDPMDVEAAVRALLDGADFVKGSRELDGGGSSDFTVFRRLGNQALTSVANLLFGHKWTDITYGFNAYWKNIIVNLDSLSDGFEFEIQAAARAARTGLRTTEISCYEAPRVGGSSKLNPVRDGWFILRLLLNEAKPRTPTSFRSTSDWHLGSTVVDLRTEPLLAAAGPVALLERAV
jgi:glycosyltransferase involved in cell wall biosynthesis